MAYKPPSSKLPQSSSRKYSQNNGHSSPAPASLQSPSRPETPASDNFQSPGASAFGGSERVKVIVRVRPALRSDEESGAVIVTDDGKKLNLCRPDATVTQSEHVYDTVLPSSSKQQDVYMAAVKDVVEDVLNGYNGTVMAYGQTGAGKTHTLGNIEPKAIGMIPRAVAEIFKRAEEDREHVYSVGMSYIQIYMELLQDLLNPKSDNMQIREDQGGVFVSGVSEVKVSSMEHCLSFLELGEKNRTFAFTHLNAHSSRSHAVVMLTVTKRARVLSVRESSEMKALEKDGVVPQKVKVGKLFLVDLAGSERLKKSKSVGLRANEAISINLSLTTLGMCINARATDSGHVPFRDSKLTRLLQESLGGNAKTTLIVCVADVKAHVDETLMSLQFASRAMCVKNKPMVNERIDYKALQNEIMSELNSDARMERRKELTAELFRQDYEILQKERDQFRLVAEALTKEREDAEARKVQMLEAKEQELRAHQQQLLQRQQELEEQRRQQQQMSETLQELKREKDQFLKKAESMTREKEDEMRTLLEEKAKAVSSQQQQMERLRSELASREKALAELQQVVEQSKAENESLERQNSKLQQQVASSVESNMQLQQEAEEQLSELRKLLEAERAQKTALLAEAKQAHKDELRELRATTSKDTSKLNQRHENEVTKLKSTHSTEISTLKATHSDELASMRGRLEDVIGRLRSELASVQESKVSELAKMQERHLAETERVKANHSSEVADLRDHVRQLQNQHQTQVRQMHESREFGHRELLDSHSDELRSIKVAHQQEVEDLHQRLQLSQSAEHRLQEDVARLSGTLQSLKSDKATLEDQSRIQQESISSLQASVAQLQSSMVDLAARSTSNLMATEAKLSEALGQKGRALDGLQRQLSKLRPQISSLQKQRKQLIGMRDSLAEQVSRLEAQGTTLEGALAAKGRELDDLRSDLGASCREVEGLRQDLDDLGLEVDSKEEENEELRGKLEGLQRTLQGLEAELEVGRRQRRTLEKKLEKASADRASALSYRVMLRRQNHAAAVIQRAYRQHCKTRLVTNLKQGNQALDQTIKKVTKLERYTQDLQQAQNETQVTFGLSLVQKSMTTFRDGVSSTMAAFLLPKKELQARLSAQQRIDRLSPHSSSSPYGFNAASPARGPFSVTPRRISGSSATTTPRTPSTITPRTPQHQRAPLSPLTSNVPKGSGMSRRTGSLNDV